MGLPNIPGLEVEGELGRGAHSIVYRGFLDGVRCAIKVPRARGRWTRWVYREAVALARVRDPGLPLVLEVGEADDLPYLIMELIEGETLAELFARRRLGWAEALELAGTLAETLASVHDTGLVHRDVKPRNLVFDRAGRLRLVDFGFATPIERLSGSFDAAGTPAYAAPEQLRTPSRVDGRADLFALGRVLAEGLAGSLPPDGAAEVQAHLLAAKVPAPVVAILIGLLAFEPQHRYPDARSLVKDLALALQQRAPRGPGAYEASARVAPFVGREVEVGAVLTAFRQVDDASGILVTVEGDRGSGKSRLMRAALAKWRQAALGPAVVVDAHDGDAPLAVLRRLLEELCGSAGGLGSPVEAARILRAAAGADLSPLARLIAPSLSAALGPLPEAAVVAPPTFAEGAAELFVRLARERGPLLLAVDGLHGVDAASLDVLLCLAHRVREAPLLLLLSSRPVSEPSRSLDRLLAVEGVRVALGPLQEHQMSALVAAHLGVEATDGVLDRLVAALAEHSPLGVLELLGALLDAGAVRPHRGVWQLDPSRAETIALPEGTLGLLGRRVAELPPATGQVLAAAAILGGRFADDLLADLLGMSVDDLGYGLADARRAGLLEPAGDGHRFVHSSLRDLLLGRMALEERQSLHQRAGEAIEARGTSSVEDVFAAAQHFAAGVIHASPHRTLAAARRATAEALERFDNETALRHLETARLAAGAAGVRLDAEDHRRAGEAHLRLGSLDASLRELELALSLASEPVLRATLLGRLAWVHQSDASPDRAWAALDAAFAVLGHRLPKESPRSVADTLAAVARHQLPRLRERQPGGAPTPHAALLCELHYQNARLGLEHGRPLRLVESAFQALDLAQRLGPSTALARSRAVHGLVLTAVGLGEAGGRELERAAETARLAGDPVAIAFATQLRSVAASFAGDLDAAVILARRCLLEHGPWLELSEYCNDATTADIILKTRGRPREAWTFIGGALERVLRSPHPSSVLADYVLHRARATRATLGEGHELIDRAAGAARGVKRAATGMMHLANLGSRATVHLESDDLGPSFEALVRSFEAEGHRPRTVHLIASEYFVAVAHARVELCLRAREGERAKPLAALQRAAADLRQAAKIPLLHAHRDLIDAWVAWFGGHDRAMQKAIARAEALAVEQRCPWVQSGVARLRAHTLLRSGRHEAGLDQARLAERLASEEGAMPRAARVRREFGLPEPAPPPPPSVRSASSRSSRRARRQLAALLQVVRAGAHDAKPDRQATAVLDELLRDLDAERAYLWFQPDPGLRARLVVSRTRGGQTSFELEGWREALLVGVRASGQAWPQEGETDLGLDGTAEVDASRILAVPLALYDRPVGAVGLERSRSAPTFGSHERDLLGVLAHQVPLALEIARLLAEREQLQVSLQQAQKMEAVGQLAGGVAHDFNNMLTAIRASLDALGDRVQTDAIATSELELVGQATQRAADLTRQLLSFSRHRPVPSTVCDVNPLLVRLEPMLKRLLGARVTVRLELEEMAHAVRVDPAALEQALVNLSVNARDAMTGGGVITISTRNEELDAEHVRRGATVAGEHLEIAVRDTGEGMSAELLGRVFEPFFTTKEPGSGTGLGLTMVYAFVKNSGGHLEVASEIGLGTTFRIFLPRSEVRTEAARPPRPRSVSPVHDATTVMIVDDERMVSRSLSKLLERSGYRVLVAHTAEDALALVDRQGGEIALVILDMLMPGMSGPELGRRFGEMQLPAKLLYISGFSPESLPLEDEVDAANFLQKPFTPADLLGRIGLLLDS